MKKLFILLLLIPILASSATYHIKNGGNNALTGLSDAQAWETITYLNSVFYTMTAGDSVVFNRGDVFYGRIYPTKEVIIGAYGTGADPIITGFTEVTGWTSIGGGIYSKSISPQTAINFITIDDELMGMGRYPDKGKYLTVKSHATNVSITDGQIYGGTQYWDNAEAVIRKNGYVLDRCTITDHTDSTLTYTSLGSSDEATNGYYYFIQNSIKTLTDFGEWSYSAGTLSVYFGELDPDDFVVKAPTLDTLYYNYSFPDVTVTDLNFTGANLTAVLLKEVDNSVVKNCTISFAGTGIYTQATDAVIEYNTINDVYLKGIECIWDNDLVRYNTITDVGMIEGMAKAGSIIAGIDNSGDGNTIEFNTITNSGYHGIAFAGTGTKINKNFISYFCVNLNDGAGVYTDNNIYTGRQITDNIILNGVGRSAEPYGQPDFAQGIYMDTESDDIMVSGNTIASCSGKGIMVSNANNIDIWDNILYNNKVGFYALEHSVGHTLTDISIRRNTFACKLTEIPLELQSNYGTIYPGLTMDSNMYVRVSPVIVTSYEAGVDVTWVNRNLTQWKAYSSTDALSLYNPTSRLYFDYSVSGKSVSGLTGFLNLLGASTTSYTIEQYGSVVLVPPATYSKVRSNGRTIKN